MGPSQNRRCQNHETICVCVNKPRAREAAMVDGACHGVRRTKAGPRQAQNGVETLMHRAWVTHHHCPLAPGPSVTGGAGIDVKQKKIQNKNK